MGLDHGLMRHPSEDEISEAEVKLFAKVKPANTNDERIFKWLAKSQVMDIAEWRKHPGIHGWMENRWREETNNWATDEDGCWKTEFNCVDYDLSTKVIEDCIEAVKSESLPHTEGFCFGDPEDEWPEDEFQQQKEYDLKALNNALELAKTGERITYWSWW